MSNWTGTTPFMWQYDELLSMEKWLQVCACSCFYVYIVEAMRMHEIIIEFRPNKCGENKCRTETKWYRVKEKQTNWVYVYGLNGWYPWHDGIENDEGVRIRSIIMCIPNRILNHNNIKIHRLGLRSLTFGGIQTIFIDTVYPCIDTLRVKMLFIHRSNWMFRLRNAVYSLRSKRSPPKVFPWN